MLQVNVQIGKILEELEKIRKSCLVITVGVEAEKEDIRMLTEYREQLLQAVDNLRDRSATLQAISIREYKRIKEEIFLMKDILGQKAISLQNLESYLKDEKNKEAKLQKHLKELNILANSKTVLNFKGKNGDK